MEKKKVINKLLSLLSIIDFDIELNELDMPLSELGVDSLDFVEFLMNVETAFNITITEDEALQLATVNQWADFIIAKPNYKKPV